MMLLKRSCCNAEQNVYNVGRAQADVGDEHAPEQQNSPRFVPAGTPASKASDAELQHMCLNDCLASCRADEMHLGLADAEGTDDMHWAPADREGNKSGLTFIPEVLSLGCMCCSSSNCKHG